MTTMNMKQVSDNARIWAVVAHASAFCAPIVGPLVLWIVMQDEDSFVVEHAKEALNFQITTTIAGLLVSLSMAVLIGCLLLPIFVVAALVLPILAIVAASQGESYQYPFNWRLVE